MTACVASERGDGGTTASGRCERPRGETKIAVQNRNLSWIRMDASCKPGFARGAGNVRRRKQELYERTGEIAA